MGVHRKWIFKINKNNTISCYCKVKRCSSSDGSIKGSYKNDVWNKNFEEMAQKTVVKKLLKWLPVSVEFLEMAAKDEKSFKVVDDKSTEVQEIEILENNGDIINAETSEFIEESTEDNKNPKKQINDDTMVQGLFKDNK